MTRSYYEVWQVSQSMPIITKQDISFLCNLIFFTRKNSILTSETIKKILGAIEKVRSEVYIQSMGNLKN